MSKTITAVFSSAETIKNVKEDLIAIGIDREKIFADAERCWIKLMVPAEIEPEIVEILDRHDPGSVTAG